MLKIIEYTFRTGSDSQLHDFWIEVGRQVRYLAYLNLQVLFQSTKQLTIQAITKLALLVNNHNFPDPKNYLLIIA